jgi:hypothetical protein
MPRTRKAKKADITPLPELYGLQFQITVRIPGPVVALAVLVAIKLLLWRYHLGL